jgi:crotonobetainyl-CoA:carnitine CoA-transferase CaiB-like acyl-CoA transferase
MSGPLAGVRVVEFSRYLPGTYFGWIAGDMGADVIRIEHPRELAKAEAMFGGGQDPATLRRDRARPTYTRNKRSITLNPGHPQARRVLYPLIASADVLVEDFRPGTMARLGLGYDAVAAINPRLVYASVSFAGQHGPLAHRAGHDPAALAAAGVLSRLNGQPVPTLPGVQVADVMAGAHATIAILLALTARGASGCGSHVDVAMIDAAMPLLMVGLGRADDPADVGAPDGAWHPKGGVWRCADGAYLCTTDMEPRYWGRFCEAIARPDLTARQFDVAAYPRIHADLVAMFASQPRAAWLALFEHADTQAMPVLTPGEALRHPNAAARGMQVELAVPGGGTVEQIGTPFAISGVTPGPHRAASLPGSDRDAILREIGMAAGEIAELAASDVFSSTQGAGA